MVTIDAVVTGYLDNNTYLVTNDETKEAFIVDPSFYVEKIEEMINKNGADLKAILITHGHFDHIISAPDLRDKYGSVIYASSGEKELLGSEELNLSCQKAQLCMTIEADRYLEDGDILHLAGVEIKAISTPGHTVGGMCFYIPEEKIIFSGDTLFAGSHGRTDFPSGNHIDMIESINKKLFTLPEDTVVYCGHGGLTTIGLEKTRNPIERI
ncbi:MAG: MBL fold metallo-hydrolase [Clostridiales bacterium]|nr:MBL fold metallo-hydrolase [Clostridiales bacterium]MDU3490143.1 MBL fold metallo-hydrolase [Clostridiales bacterium]